MKCFRDMRDARQELAAGKERRRKKKKSKPSLKLIRSINIFRRAVRFNNNVWVAVFAPPRGILGPAVVVYK